MPWTAIQLVTGPLTLLAFLALVVLQWKRRAIKRDERTLEQLPPEERPRYARGLLQGVDTDGLTRAQRVELAQQRLRRRAETTRSRFVLTIVLALIAAATFLASLVIAKPPGTVRLLVTVESPQGAALEAARTRVSIDQIGAPGQAGEDLTTFEIARDNLADSSEVTVRAEYELLRGKTTVSIPEGARTVRVVVRLEPPEPVPLVGRVRDFASDQPIEGARVSVGADDTPARSGADGTFELAPGKGVGERVLVTVEHDLYETEEQPHILGSGDCVVYLQRREES